jgi:hypothetical protein
MSNPGHTNSIRETSNRMLVSAKMHPNPDGSVVIFSSVSLVSKRRAILPGRMSLPLLYNLPSSFFLFKVFSSVSLVRAVVLCVHVLPMAFSVNPPHRNHFRTKFNEIESSDVTVTELNEIKQLETLLPHHGPGTVPLLTYIAK